MKKLIVSSILGVVLLSISPGVQAQTSYKFSSTFVVNEPSDYLKLNEIRNLFDKAMEARGAEYSGKEGFLFLIGISDETESGLTALSITTLAKMPENIVQAGKYSQVFYLALEEDDGITQVTEAGNMIRDEITEDFLRQFNMIWKQRTLIVEASKLEEEISKVAEDIISDVPGRN